MIVLNFARLDKFLSSKSSCFIWNCIIIKKCCMNPHPVESKKTLLSPPRSYILKYLFFSFSNHISGIVFLSAKLSLFLFLLAIYSSYETLAAKLCLTYNSILTHRYKIALEAENSYVSLGRNSICVTAASLRCLGYPAVFNMTNSHLSLDSESEHYPFTGG